MEVETSSPGDSPDILVVRGPTVMDFCRFLFDLSGCDAKPECKPGLLNPTQLQQSMDACFFLQIIWEEEGGKHNKQQYTVQQISSTVKMAWSTWHHS